MIDTFNLLIRPIPVHKEKLASMNKNQKLPPPPQPLGDYSGVIIRNGIGFVSGQFPIKNGCLLHSGNIGSDLSKDQALEAIQVASINTLSHISNATNSFKTLEGILRLDGHLSCANNFKDHIEILDRASRIFNDYLGEKGKHSRSLFIHNKLPLNSPIELCVSFCTTKAKNTEAQNF